MKVVILPIGQVAADVLQFMQGHLKEVFPQTEVAVLETVMPIPREAYDSSRRQYHSTHILAKVSNYVRRAQAQYVLGVTEADLYVPSLNFVFGEAQRPGNAALISLRRLKPEFYREPPSKEVFHERALKEAVHEIGHTLSLGHCSNPLCIMFFSDSIRNTDRKRTEFCEKCRPSVLKALKRIKS